MKQNKIIGLTGGSGSGKSTVASALEKLGAFVIDCDKIAHENMALGGIAYDEIVARFGRDILSNNGQIDRKKLASIVFSDEKELESLNLITHKHITDRVMSLIRNAQSKIIVIDAPLLHKAGLDKLCDEVWVTDAPYEVRLERITQRDSITKAEAQARLKNQEKYDRYDRLIITDFDTISDLEEYIKELIC